MRAIEPFRGRTPALSTSGEKVVHQPGIPHGITSPERDVCSVRAHAHASKAIHFQLKASRSTAGGRHAPKLPGPVNDSRATKGRPRKKDGIAEPGPLLQYDTV